MYIYIYLGPWPNRLTQKRKGGKPGRSQIVKPPELILTQSLLLLTTVSSRVPQMNTLGINKQGS